MTDTTTAPTPEELAQQAFPNGCIRGRTLKLTDAVMADIRSTTAAAIRQHLAPLEAQIAELTAERDRARNAAKDFAKVIHLRCEELGNARGMRCPRHDGL